MPQNKKLIEELKEKINLRAKSLLVTVYGDAILPHGGSVSLASLIKLVDPLGLSERMVRTAVFRLSKDEWLSSSQIGRRSFYRLTETGRRRFESADQRIYAMPHQIWNGEWLLAIVNKPQLDQDTRDQLRREFVWMGFGVIAPNVFAHPAANMADVRQFIQEQNLGDDIVLMSAKADGTSPLAPMREIVHNCWDLDQLSENYHEFLDRFRPVYHHLSTRDDITDEDCFIIRTLLIHEYRRITLRDPMLPDELLRADWPGTTAATLCANLYQLTAMKAENHLNASLETAEGPLPDASPYFYNRFGGLETFGQRRQQ